MLGKADDVNVDSLWISLYSNQTKGTASLPVENEMHINSTNIVNSTAKKRKP